MPRPHIRHYEIVQGNGGKIVENMKWKAGEDKSLKNKGGEDTTRLEKGT